MKTTISIRTLIVSSVLFFCFISCYGKGDPSDLLVGKWTKLLNERAISISLTSDFKFQVDFAGDAEFDVWGSYDISETKITFNDEGGEYSSDEEGVYQFQVSETSLTFTPVNDPVYGRSILMEGSWSKAVEDD